jgi:hypothetical protein
VIESRRALDTEQVRIIAFPHMPSGQRKAQERLLKLYRKNRIQRQALGYTFAYFRGDCPGMVQHLIDLNWVRLWAERKLKLWGDLHSWEYEPDYGILRADALVALKNARGEFQFLFVELDRGTNTFDKIEKYCRLYKSGGYNGRWWVSLTKRFPSIIIVAPTPGRLKNIRKLVEKQNTEGLEFKTYLLEDLKGEVLK